MQLFRSIIEKTLAFRINDSSHKLIFLVNMFKSMLLS